MAVLPTPDQLPAFVRMRAWLTHEACQCMWYLPDKRRSCLVRINEEDSRKALQLVVKVLQKISSTTKSLELLAEIAELNCCLRHHRNKIWGSGLASKLAVRWQLEMSEIVSNPTSKPQVTVKLEPSIHSPCNIAAAGTSSALVKQESIDVHVISTSIFSKHVVLERETLASALLSKIEFSASKEGSVYIFSYPTDEFKGMLKIGFTSKSVNDRLKEWAQCGYGSPNLQLDNKGRHPARVESLTHFELLQHWYALRWCKLHRQAHIEWFRINVASACRIVQTWSLWMGHANPYDRRGCLKRFWHEAVEFLLAYEIPITAEVMMGIYEIEEGSINVADFFDDNALRTSSKRRWQPGSRSSSQNGYTTHQKVNTFGENS